MPDLHNPRLILSPCDKSFSITDHSEFIEQLVDLNFIDKKNSTHRDINCFEMGDDFLHQVSFLGCSPTLSGENEIFISIINLSELSFFYSSDIPPPRCPHCNKTDKNWQQYYKNWQQNRSTTETCPSCHKPYQFTDMKWKKNGGYGKLLIQIHGVQEQLAVPNPLFLDELKKLTHTDWEYFFADH